MDKADHLSSSIIAIGIYVPTANPTFFYPFPLCPIFGRISVLGQVSLLKATGFVSLCA